MKMVGSSRKQGGSAHLRFEKLPLEKGKKLNKFKVINDLFNEKIGFIYWRGGWRQYVFKALPEMDMSRSCHKEIDNFIDGLMKEWRDSKKNNGKK